MKLFISGCLCLLLLTSCAPPSALNSQYVYEVQRQEKARAAMESKAAIFITCMKDIEDLVLDSDKAVFFCSTIVSLARLEKKRYGDITKW